MARAAPRVTIVLATYDWSAVLPFSIGSALDQSFADFELIVVGDGCTDDSAEVVAGIGDARVRWVNLPANVGHQSAPNNEGLRQARGELVAYLGHDDLWLPHHLNCLTEAIASGSDLAYGIVGSINSAESSQMSFPAPRNYERGMWIPPTGVVHRRKLAEALGGWRN